MSDNASAESSTPKERLELRSGFGAPVAKEKYISILVGRCLHRFIVEHKCKFAHRMEGYLISSADLNVSKEEMKITFYELNFKLNKFAFFNGHAR